MEKDYTDGCPCSITKKIRKRRAPDREVGLNEFNDKAHSTSYQKSNDINPVFREGCGPEEKGRKYKTKRDKSDDIYKYIR